MILRLCVCLLGLGVAVFFGLPATAAIPQADICGIKVAPKAAVEIFKDHGVATDIWRTSVSACGARLSVIFWNQADHWLVTLERDVTNPFAERLPAIAVTASLAINGKTVSAINGPLYEFQVAMIENKQLKPALSPAALRSARLVPPIEMLKSPQKPDNLTLSHWSVKPFTSLKSGPLERGMPNTGERPDIGVIHEWCAMWLNYPSDYWWTACLDAAKDSANVPWHVAWKGKPNLFTAPEMRRAGFDARNEPGKRIALPEDEHEALSPDTATGSTWVYRGEKSRWSLDHAHQPFAQLVPYMATRHPLFLYLAQYQFGVQLGGLNAPAGYGGRDTSLLPTVLLDQDRGLAWSLRTMSQVVLMTPEGAPVWLHSRADVKRLFAASINRWSAAWDIKRRYWHALRLGTAPKPDTAASSYIVKATGRTAYAMQIWETDYLAQSLGFAKWAGLADVEPLYQYTRDILIDRYGPGSPFRSLGAPFTVVFSDPKTGQAAKSLEDVVRYSSPENITYATKQPLKVGERDSIGQWTELSWHVQGELALCVANGDTRCQAPLAWWNRQAEEKGSYVFDKYRMGIGK